MNPSPSPRSIRKKPHDYNKHTNIIFFISKSTLLKAQDMRNTQLGRRRTHIIIIERTDMKTSQSNDLSNYYKRVCSITCLAALSSCHLSKSQYPGSVQNANSLALTSRKNVEFKLCYRTCKTNKRQAEEYRRNTRNKPQVLGYYKPPKKKNKRGLPLIFSPSLEFTTLIS
jgi:Zn ribbon nucleic-acid-binding protein